MSETPEETLYEVTVVNPITGKNEVFTGEDVDSIKAEIENRFGPE